MPKKNPLTKPLLSGQDSDRTLDRKVDTSVGEKKSARKFIPHVAFNFSEEKPRTLSAESISDLNKNARTRTSFMGINTPQQLQQDQTITALVSAKVDETFPAESKTKKEQLINTSLDLLDDNSIDCAQTVEQNKLIQKDAGYVIDTLTGGDPTKMDTAQSLQTIKGRPPHVVRKNGSTVELIMDERYKLATPDQTKSKPDDQPDVSARIIVRAQFDEKGNRKENLVTREYTAHTPAGLERLRALDIELAPDLYRASLRKAQDKLVDSTSEDENSMSAAIFSDTLDTQARLIAKYYTNIIQSLVELEKLTREIDHSEPMKYYQDKLAKIIKNSNQHGLRYEFYNDEKLDVSQRDQIRNALGKSGLSPKAYLQIPNADGVGLYYNELGKRIDSNNALISDTNAFLSSLNKAELEDDAKKVVDHFDLNFSNSSDEFDKKTFMDNLPKNSKKKNTDSKEYKSLKDLVKSSANSSQSESKKMVGQVRDNDGFDYLHSTLTGMDKTGGLDDAHKTLLQYMNLMKAGADLNVALTQAKHYTRQANDARDKIIVTPQFSHLGLDDFIEFENHYNKVRTNFDLYPELGVLRDMLHEYCVEFLTWNSETRLEKITKLHKHILENNSAQHFYSHPAQKMMIGLSRKVQDELDFVSAVLPTLPGQREEHRKHVPKPDVTLMTRMVSYMQTRPISSSLLIGIIMVTSIAAIILFAWPAIAAAVGASVPAFLTTALSSTFQGISIVAAGYIAAGASFMLSGIVSYFSTKKTPTVEVRFDSEKDKATSNVGIAHANWGSETYMPKHAKAQIFINAFLQGKIKPNNPESKILNDIFVDRHSKDSIEIREFIATNNDLFEQVKQYTAIAALRESLTGNTEKNTAPATIPSDKASAKALSKVGLLGDRGARAAASREDQPSPVDPDEQRTEETTPRPGGRTEGD